MSEHFFDQLSFSLIVFDIIFILLCMNWKRADAMNLITPLKATEQVV